MSLKTKSLLLAAGTAAVASFGAQGAMAQSNGFYLNGYVEAATGGYADTYGVAELSLGYDAASAGGGNWGVNVDVTGIAGASYDTVFVNPYLYMDTSYGRVSLGRTGSITGDYVVIPEWGGSSILGVEARVVSGGVMDFVVLDNMSYYGVRFDGSAGNFDYGLSVNAAEGAMIYSAAGSYNIGSYTLAASIDDLDGVDIFYAASISGDFDRFGVSLSAAKSFVAAPRIFYTLEMTYQAMDNLELQGGITKLGGASNMFSYAGLRYTFFENGYANLSLLGMPSGGIDSEIAVGWNFNIGG